jgi:hypothetical protein
MSMGSLARVGNASRPQLAGTPFYRCEFGLSNKNRSAKAERIIAQFAEAYAAAILWETGRSEPPAFMLDFIQYRK